MKESPKSILWSVDAFPTDKGVLTKAATVLKAFAANAGESLTVTPVYVLPISENDLPAGLGSQTLQQTRDAAKKTLDALLKRVSVPHLASPKILVSENSGIRGSVNALIRHAEMLHSDLIVITTHGRTGLKRLFMGSFAETMILHSTVPVLVVNPGTEFKGKMKRLLFPTDLTQASHPIFQQVVAFAARIKAEIDLYHVVPNPIEPLIGAGVYLLGGNWIPVRNYFKDVASQQSKLANTWAEEAKRSGVSVDIEIDSRGVNITQAILARAKKTGADLIAMPSKSSPMGSALIGSIARQVVRSATTPVWVLHEKQNRQPFLRSTVT